MTSTTRRNFIKVSAAAGGALSLGVVSKTRAVEKPKPLRILILGGTGFTGPFQVQYALERGHKVTVFNRGKTHPGELPKEVEQLIGDRNGQLDALKNRKWDVAIDNPTSVPVWVRDVGQILKGNVDRYVFISTISVYGDTSKANLDETAPLFGEGLTGWAVENRRPVWTNRAHLDPRVRVWNGDSRAHWDGDALVVDTTNFSPKSDFMGSHENLRLTEKFTRVGPEILNYEFTVDDPTTWTAPWTAMIPLRAKNELIFEYACHEGNEAIPDMLRGHRFEEREASKTRSK